MCSDIRFIFDSCHEQEIENLVMSSLKDASVDLGKANSSFCM